MTIKPLIAAPAPRVNPPSPPAPGALQAVPRLPTIDEIAAWPIEDIAKLSGTTIEKVGRKHPEVLKKLFDNAPPATKLPSGKAWAAHVTAKPVKLPFLVNLGFEDLHKTFTGSKLEDHTAWYLPNSKANVSLDCGDMVTEYRTHGQAFGTYLGFYDRFRQVNATTWIGESTWVPEGKAVPADPNWRIVLDFAR